MIRDGQGQRAKQVHRYYIRAAPEFETADPRYVWLNNIVPVTKSRTGDGGVIHRIFAIK